MNQRIHILTRTAIGLSNRILSSQVPVCFDYIVTCPVVVVLLSVRSVASGRRFGKLLQ
jgi:hypothetical protein